MRFKYTALSPNNQKVEGVLTAETLALAQEEMHKMGFSILSLNEIAESEFAKLKIEKEAKKTAEGIKAFRFSAIDPSGKTVEGTIDAENDAKAFRRLVTEYGFRVKELYTLGAGENERKASGARVKELEQELKASGIDPESFAKKKEETDTQSAVNPELLGEIDRLIQNTKKVLGENKSLFSPPRLKAIETTLGDLERIRTSNNIKHIAEVASQLLEVIRHPDLAGATEKAEVSPAFEEIKKPTRLEDELKKYKQALGLSGVRSLFDRIKKSLGHLGGKSPLPQPEPSDPSPSSPKTPTTSDSLAPSFKRIVRKFIEWQKAPNAVARQARHFELIEAWAAWRSAKKPPAQQAATLSIAPAAPKELVPGKPKKDFTLLFQEIDSFSSWLLFFYLGYFFLASFSLEKNVGLPESFVVKTLKSPLLLNVALGLLFTHLLLKIKLKAFRQNALGSLFLFSFGYGVLFLILSNF